jgi:hypothetical protein
MCSIGNELKIFINNFNSHLKMKDYHYILIGGAILLAVALAVFFLSKKPQPKMVAMAASAPKQTDWSSIISSHVGTFTFPKCASCVTNPTDAQIAAGTPDYMTSKLFIQPTTLACNSFEKLQARI